MNRGVQEETNQVPREQGSCGANMGPTWGRQQWGRYDINCNLSLPQTSWLSYGCPMGVFLLTIQRCHDANVATTGGTGLGHCNNLWCHRWWKSWYHENSWSSVFDRTDKALITAKYGTLTMTCKKMISIFYTQYFVLCYLGTFPLARGLRDAAIHIITVAMTTKGFY